MLADDPSQVDYLTDRLLAASTTELPVLRELLQPHKSKLVARLWSVLETAKPGEPTLLAGRKHPGPVCSGRPRWTRHAEKIAELLVRSNPLSLGYLARALPPCSDGARRTPGRHPAQPRPAANRKRARAGRNAPFRLRQRSTRRPGRSSDGCRPDPLCSASASRPAAGGEGQADLAGGDLQEARLPGKR